MNILLTGKYNIGKSTLLSRIITTLDIQCSGFTSFTIEKDNEIVGFKMAPLDEETEPFTIGLKDTPFTCQPYEDAFDTLGVELLNRSLKDKTSTIIMDELGFLESKAFTFQEKVIQCFESDQTVIGVLKDRHTPFLDKIRNRDDIFFYNVTELNRDNLLKEISALIMRGEEK